MKTSIRWVGGKKRILPEINKRIPQFDVFFEPFVGGGAVLHHIQPKAAVIGDANTELINYYTELQKNWRDIYDTVSTQNFSKDDFLKIRSLDRNPGLNRLSTLERACRFLFLNKTSFQGMWRINRHGFYTTPYCYPKKLALDPGVMEASSELLKHATFYSGSYQTTISSAKKGDFIYFDPPYYHSAKDASMFQSYTAESFDNSQHTILAEECRKLDQKGVKWLLSNVDCKEVRDLWNGFQIDPITLKQTMAGKTKNRKPAYEVLIYNY